ncbi:DUF4282 domain-containing protein [Algiphilus sp.]|uniref:DUF4282 domain-containing protein n=1 Tax=Algiphilus sp. TaxID=1872431 RepID=UPI001CA755AA|nr:DUF4282 domain-containing protein [Algiphilus sp.]MBY8965383.1 DUF4282 domain-containing protein [Algiphilus acroporae]MCI5063339.1 DUF4282 domain-containing protein [Algiphilus sp.]MCI5102871.1 DUF4282 domain-containing protein [Algiphilus sp.]MCR9090602.1 DUF4282 domain-containing protein [Pseudomonadota bacterium]
MTDPHQQTEPSTVSSLLGGLGAALMDLRFRTVVSVRMLPAAYVVLVSGLAAILLSRTVSAFAMSLWQGLIELFLVTPIYFIAGLVFIRVALEFVHAVFRIAANVDALRDWSQDIHGVEALRDALKTLVIPKGRGGNADDG